MFNITAELNKASKVPIYEQLYKLIADEIRAHGIAEGERLPSKKALAAHLRISVNTVETAYAILAQEGYIISKPRSGYYVQRVEAPIGASPVSAEEKPVVRKKYRADFKTNAVDVESFPYSTWVKLSKEVMYENPELLSTGDFRGDIELRESIVKYLREFRGVSCTPSQVVIGAGIEYLLTLLTMILKNGVYAVENPGYGKTEEILRNSGCVVNYIPLDENGMRIDRLKETNSDIVYITPSHQFPTGAVMPVGRRLELLKWAKEREGRYIIEDDYNGEFNFTVKPVPAVQGLIENSRVIYISTFSRTLAPSIRISYMVLPPELNKEYEKRFRHYTSTVPRFEQHTLNRFMEGGYFARHLNRVRNIYKKRCEELFRLLNEYGLKVSGETAGLHLLVKTKRAEELLQCGRERDIRLYSLDDYYFTPREKPSDTVIIGYAGCGAAELALLREVLDEKFERRS